MNKTPETFLNPDMPTIMTNTGAERPKTEIEMTYLEKKNINEAIYKN